jgi:phosphoglycerate dehydrogenase-like enzyme
VCLRPEADFQRAGAVAAASCELMQMADVVTLHVGLLPTTEGMNRVY